MLAIALVRVKIKMIPKNIFLHFNDILVLQL